MTGLQLSVVTQISPRPVVGSDFIPFIPHGRISVGGQLTAYFEDTDLRDKFIDETESTIHILLKDHPALNADSISIFLPLVKFQGADKADSDSAMFPTVALRALEQFDAVDGHVQSTVMMQDSRAV